MQDWIVELMNSFTDIGYAGYVGIALLIAIENLFPPIPSEVILTLGGFMTTYSDLTIWGVILSATIGSVLGAILLYLVGTILSVERLGKILDGRIGRLLHFKKEDVMKACDWFNSKGKTTVLFCRCVPILRSLISIPAGMSKMKFSMFLLFTTIGSFVWNIVLVHLGVAAGASWEKILAGTGIYTKITVVILGLIALIVCYFFIKRILKDRMKTN